MTFIQAALTLLGETGAPLHVDELTRLAVERELLTRPGKNPLGSMKAQLTRELKKGTESRVERVDDGVWQIRSAAEEVTEPETAEPAEVARPDEVSEPAGPELVIPESPNPALDEVLAPISGVQRLTPPPPSDEEAAELYAREAEQEQGIAHPEYRDAQTADEDRPMLPEIVAKRDRREWRKAERRKRKERKEQRRREREAREKVARAARGGATAVAPAAEVALATEVPAAERAGVARFYMAGNEYGDGAVAALDSIKGVQPVQVKQLAQMMRKRQLIDSGEAGWELLKAALLEDAESYAARGLRPRITHRGRDLFQLQAHRLPDAVATSETALERAVVASEVVTHRALASALQSLTPGALDRVVKLYLMRTGWSGIETVKDVESTRYSMATPPGRNSAVLVSVRAGTDEVDRRGVGELRAGVDAKNLGGGYLFAPTAMSEAADAEIGREGKPVVAVCGDQLVAELMRAAVGVKRAAVPVHRFDADFFAQLGE